MERRRCDREGLVRKDRDANPGQNPDGESPLRQHEQMGARAAVTTVRSEEATILREPRKADIGLSPALDARQATLEGVTDLATDSRRSNRAPARRLPGARGCPPEGAQEHFSLHPYSAMPSPAPGAVRPPGIQRAIRPRAVRASSETGTASSWPSPASIGRSGNEKKWVGQRQSEDPMPTRGMPVPIDLRIRADQVCSRRTRPRPSQISITSV